MHKVNKALMRIKQAYEIAHGMGKTLIVAYSGGKDSDVLLHLAIKSGMPFEVQHNHTTADAPQTVYHIRKVFAWLTAQGVPNKINYPPDIVDVNGNTVRASMWNLIPKKQMPPTRLARYCCEYFKERNFEGQHIMTGVRWAENNARKQRGVHETLNRNKDKRVVYFDEDDDRHKLVDICQSRNRVASNPIIDFSDDEVWAYIRANSIKTNPLYSQGLMRVGCIGCPMAGGKGQIREFEMFPKYRAAYIRAFERMIRHKEKRRKVTGNYDTPIIWKDGEYVMRWWTDRQFNPNQLSLDDILKSEV